MENSMGCPQKIKNRTIIQLSDFMSAYLSEGNELLSWKDICILMFVTALFTTAKIQKQPKNPLTDEWIKRMWYIHTHTHTLKYYTDIRKEILLFVTIWMDLRPLS